MRNREVGNSLRTTVVLIVIALLTLLVIDKAKGASTSTLHHREARQVQSLHKWNGTVRFFYNHPKQAHSTIGKREAKKAHIWVKIIKKELAETRAALHPKQKFSTSGMITAGASWYGPGFYGNTTACNITLSTSLMGVANKSLGCGTMVTICYNSKCARVPVVDRGPYVTGREFDLTGATAVYLRYSGSAPVQYCVC